LEPERVQVAGNLPYYITSDILLKLFAYRRYFDSIVIMVQREVADRIAAQAGTRDYGLLSATAQLHARVERILNLPPGAFHPAPRVHSSVLRLTMDSQAESLGVPVDEFVGFLKLSFGQKRKTLWNNLKSRYDADALRGALADTKIKANVRAEALPLQKTAALFHALQEAQGSEPSNHQEVRSRTGS
jgi:16S rRNA (adenine1518-N6/adenine1519-N6)-dimethyltransferase